MRLDEPVLFKKGDRHPETGLLFWGIQRKPYGKYPMWLTDEKFEEYQRKAKAHGAIYRKTITAQKYQAYGKKYRDKMKHDPAWRERRNAKARIRHKRNRENRSEMVREWKRQYHLRNISNPEYRLKKNLRARIGLCIRRSKEKKDRGTVAILGCSISFLRKYLEARFKDGMTWQNYGSEWHVDHIQPLASAKSLKEIYSLCRYTNLQPLWASENLSKHDNQLKQTEFSLGQ